MWLIFLKKLKKQSQRVQHGTRDLLSIAHSAFSGDNRARPLLDGETRQTFGLTWKSNPFGFVLSDDDTLGTQPFYWENILQVSVSEVINRVLQSPQVFLVSLTALSIQGLPWLWNKNDGLHFYAAFPFWRQKVSVSLNKEQTGYNLKTLVKRHL